MQQEGLEEARKFWERSPEKGNLSAHASELFEEMIAFYANLGFVPKSKFDELVKENAGLKKENEFLKKTIQELNIKVFEEGSAKVQDAWQNVIEKQMEINKEMAENFLDLFKKSSGEQ
jgi:regulator of replication initiation timing